MFAVKLSRQINTLRATRLEMEKIIGTFNATVLRCESGIRELKQVARTSGDDLEKLIERGQSLRDELVFISESADQIATLEQFIPAAIADDLFSRDAADVPAELLRTLNYVTEVAPSYSLRGGTRDILRGMIARGLGLR